MAQTVRSCVLGGVGSNPVIHLTNEQIEVLLANMTPINESQQAFMTSFANPHAVHRGLKRRFGAMRQSEIDEIAEVILETTAPQADGLIHLDDFFAAFERAEVKEHITRSTPTSATPGGELPPGGGEGDLMDLLPLASMIKLEATFQSIDTNGDGFLDQDEVVAALRLTFPRADERTLLRIAHMLAEHADLNHDGLIDLKEYTMYFSKNQGQRLTSVEKLRKKSSSRMLLRQKTDSSTDGDNSSFGVFGARGQDESPPPPHHDDPMQHLSPAQIEALIRTFRTIEAAQGPAHSRDNLLQKLNLSFSGCDPTILEDVADILLDTASVAIESSQPSSTLAATVEAQEQGQEGEEESTLVDPTDFLLTFAENAAEEIISGRRLTLRTLGVGEPVQAPRTLQYSRPSTSKTKETPVPVGALSKADTDMLRDTFILLDTNGDGFLDPVDIDKVLLSTIDRQETAQQLIALAVEKFRSADLDQDQRLSMEEFIGSFKNGLDSGVIPPQVVSRSISSIKFRLDDEEFFSLRQSFHYFDKDEDGLLNRRELGQFVQYGVRQELPAQELENLIDTVLDKADRTGDGCLNISEFIRSVQEDQGVIPPILLFCRTEQFLQLLHDDELVSGIEGILFSLPTNYLTFEELYSAVLDTVESSDIEITGDQIEGLTAALMADASADDTVDPPKFSVRGIVRRLAGTSWSGAPNAVPPDSARSGSEEGGGSRPGSRPPLVPHKGHQRSTSGDQQESSLARRGSYVDPETPRPVGRGHRSVHTEQGEGEFQQSPPIPSADHITITDQASGNFIMTLGDRHRDLSRLFAFLDEDNDGFISSTEPTVFELTFNLLKQRHPAWSQKATSAVVESLFCAADTNEDGKLDEDEFIESFESGYGVLPEDYVESMVPRLAKPIGLEDWYYIDHVLELCAQESGLDSQGNAPLDSVLPLLRLHLSTVYSGDPATVQAVIEGFAPYAEDQVLPAPPPSSDSNELCGRRMIPLAALVAHWQTNREVMTFPILVAELPPEPEVAMQPAIVPLGSAPPGTEHEGGLMQEATLPTMIPAGVMTSAADVLVIDPLGGGTAGEGVDSLPPQMMPMSGTIAPMGATATLPPQQQSAPYQAAQAIDYYIDLETGKLLSSKFEPEDFQALDDALDAVASISPEALGGEEAAQRIRSELDYLGNFAGKTVMQNAILSAIMSHSPRDMNNQLLMKELRSAFGRQRTLLVYKDEADLPGSSRATTSDGLGATGTAGAGAYRYSQDGTDLPTGSAMSPVTSSVPNQDLAERVGRGEKLLEANLAPVKLELLALTLVQQDYRKDGSVEYGPLREQIGARFPAATVPLIIQAICESAERIAGDVLHLLLFIRHFCARWYVYHPGWTYLGKINQRQQREQQEQDGSHQQETGSSSMQSTQAPRFLASRAVTITEKLDAEKVLAGFSDLLRQTGQDLQPEQQLAALEDSMATYMYESLSAAFGDDELTLQALVATYIRHFHALAISPPADINDAVAAAAASLTPIQQFMKAISDHDVVVPSVELLPVATRVDILTRKLQMHLRKDELRSLTKALLRADKRGTGIVTVDALSDALDYEWTVQFGVIDGNTAATTTSSGSPSVVIDTVLSMLLPAVDVVEDLPVPKPQDINEEGGTNFKTNGNGSHHIFSNGVALNLDLLIGQLLYGGNSLVGAEHVKHLICRLPAAPSRTVDGEDASATREKSLSTSIQAALAQFDVDREGFDTPHELSSSLMDCLLMTLPQDVAKAVQGFFLWFDEYALHGHRHTISEALRCFHVEDNKLVLGVNLGQLPPAVAASAVWTSLGPKRIREITTAFAALDTKKDRYLDLEELEGELHKEFGRRVDDLRAHSKSQKTAVGFTEEEFIVARMTWPALAFEHCDVDGDSFLSLEEFLASFTSQDWSTLTVLGGPIPSSGMVPISTVVRLHRIVHGAPPLASVLDRTPPPPRAPSPPAPVEQQAAAGNPTETAATTAGPPTHVPSPPRSSGGGGASFGGTLHRRRHSTDAPVLDDELQEAFRRYDKDNHGVLDRTEFHRVYLEMENFGLELTEVDVNRMFKECTGSDTGPISFDAFCLLMLRRAKM